MTSIHNENVKQDEGMSTSQVDQPLIEFSLYMLRTGIILTLNFKLLTYSTASLNAVVSL